MADGREQADVTGAQRDCQEAQRCQQAGDFARASQLFALAVQKHRACGEAWLGLGRIALQAQQPEKSVELFKQALLLRPQDPDCFAELGQALHATGNLQAAKLALEAALKQAPQHLLALLLLGDACGKLGDWEQAEARLRQAVLAHPRNVIARNNLGHVLGKRQKFAEAFVEFEAAQQLDPQQAQIALNRGRMHTALEQHAAAVAALERAIELDPLLTEAWFTLGNVRRSLHQTGASIAAYERTLQLQPQHCDALTNLGNAFKDQGRIEEALKCFRQALTLQPEHFASAANVLSTVHYDPTMSVADIADVHRQWEATFASSWPSKWPTFANARTLDRPLRLGFSSNALGEHPVGFYAWAAFEALDRSKFEKFVYSNRADSDELADRFRAASTRWHNVVSMSDSQVAELIQADRIDILIDLAGHLLGGRPLLLARKPAPVIVNWIGYTGTLGLRAVDYLIADARHIPTGFEPHYVERVVRLPRSHIAFEPPAMAPDVGELPALAQGHVTFGSFNNPAKLNRDVLGTWSELLHAVPRSRLLLKYRNLDDVSTEQHFRQQFRALGIDDQRIEFAGKSAFNEMLADYRRIDIALDPFPFTGGMTTLLALWMGCPVMTWPRDTFASRQSLSYLSAIGMTETVASSREEYISIAAGLANDLTKLADLRQRLRPMMRTSALCDREQFAVDLGDALRGMWSDYISRGTD